MRYLSSFIVGFSLACLLCHAGHAAEAIGKPLAEALRPLGLAIPGAESYLIDRDVVAEHPVNPVRTLTAKLHENIIRVEAVSHADAEYAKNYRESKYYTVQSLYRTLDNPYPGMVSNKINCPDEYKPEIVDVTVNAVATKVYLLYGTPRLTYGACSEDLVAYRGALLALYDEKDQIVYQIERFMPKEKYDKTELLRWVAGITCGAAKPLAAAAKASAPAVWTCKDYNLVVIGFDPLGANHLGTYGYARDTAPNLDRFARRSFLFANAVSPSCWTLPVFMSWFTSLYPSQHKITNKYSVFDKDDQHIANLSELSPSVQTLAQVLKQHGYSTAGFTGDSSVGREFGYGLGFDEYYDQTPFAGFDLVLPKAEEWLSAHDKEKYFLFIHAYDVHGRYQQNGQITPKFLDGSYKGKYKGTPDEYWQLRDQSLDQAALEMTLEDLAFWRTWYDEKIYQADLRLQQFLDYLDRTSSRSRTIIVISSASGNEFYEHKRFDHGFSLYEELIRVPFILQVPGHEPRKIQEQVSLLNLMPTLLQLLEIEAGQEVRQQMKGVSLLPLMQGKALSLDAYSETDYLLQAFKRSVRTPDGWKFILSLETGQRELYNLKDDPEEQHNLAASEAKKALELEQKVLAWMKTMGQDQFYHKEVLKKTFKLE